MKGILKKLTKTSYVLLCSVFIIQSTGCGTILYPERKGQRAGQIDVGVALLNGIGLLFFIIPGVIAYAVDFNNGTIYLPGTSQSSLNQTEIKSIRFDPKHTSLAKIEQLVKNQTGYNTVQSQATVIIARLKSPDNMNARIEHILPEIQNSQLSQIR